MVPNLAEPELTSLKSQAEAKFYRLCRDLLPRDWLVLFSVPWVGTTVAGRRYDGEADFILFIPGSGLLVIEVKGGGVEYVPSEGRWYSTDGRRNRHAIKDPFRQVVAEKHAVLDILRNDAGWKGAHSGWALAGHAVMLPDVDRVEGAAGPESPREILGGRTHLGDVQKWVESVLTYWAGQSRDWQPLSLRSLSAAESALSGPLEARPLMAVQLEVEERVRLQLTEQQGRVLRAISSRKRASICGGAGTGKTLLAMERSRALAKAGNRTLLICYNRLLADFMKVACEGESNLFAMTYHQLCEWRVNLARERSGRELLEEAKATYAARTSQDLFDVQLPYALALSAEVLEDRFDAVIIDEGQDFREEYWIGVELLLRDEVSSLLYVFYDQNQSLYTKARSMPVKDEPFVLSFNCRNTASIHQLAYGFFSGDATDPPPGNPGVPIAMLTAPTAASQAEALHAAIVNLLVQERVHPRQIGVLVCGQPKEAFMSALRGRPLPRGVAWSFEGPALADGIRVDTVRRFKGLEADVVFLWGIDSVPTEDSKEILYVGISRAKSRLTLVGSAGACRELLAKANERNVLTP